MTTRYELKFHCGATMVINNVPDPSVIRRNFREITIEGTPFRLRLPRVIVSDEKRLRLSSGECPDCYRCKGNRRKSSRQEYMCFPDDYEKNKENYKDKRFFDFAIRRIACFPAIARKITGETE